MTVTIQLSDKRGDAILLVKSEAPSVEIAEAEIAAGVGLVGLAAAYESFGAPAGPVATIPAITQLTRQQEPWGQPPVPQFQPQQQPQYAPQVPAAAAAPVQGGKVCQHGPKTYKSGNTNGRDWAFWGCNAQKNDPTKCEKEWA